MPAAVLKKVAYTTSATAKGGRSGHIHSEDGVIDLDLAQPGTSDHPAANPETLFASGYASCFQGALINRAEANGADASESIVTAAVSFGGTDDGGFGLAVDIQAHIPDLDLVRAQELVEVAHSFCPYSKATRGNIVVTVKAV